MSLERLSEYNRGILLRSFIVVRALPIYDAAEEMVADFAYRCLKKEQSSFKDSLQFIPERFLHMSDEIRFVDAQNKEYDLTNPIPDVIRHVKGLYTRTVHGRRQAQAWMHSLQRSDHPAARTWFHLPYAMPMTADGIPIPYEMVDEADEIQSELNSIAEKLRKQKDQIQFILDSHSTFNQLWNAFPDGPDRRLLREMANNFSQYRSAYALNADLIDKAEFKRLTVVGDRYKTLCDLLNDTQPEVEMSNGTFRLKMRDEHGRIREIPLMTTTRLER